MLSTDKKISIANIELQAWIWLGLPMLLFLYGWMRWWISLPLCALLIYSTARVIIRQRKQPVTERGGETHGRWQDVTVTRSYKMSLLFLFIFLVLIGMGGFFPQHYDYVWRNAVFFDLVRRDWPVVYEAPDPQLMCYYFGYWLPASLVGKATGGLIMPGDIATLFWGFWGMAIGFTFLVSFLGGRTRWWYLPVLLMFGFWDSTIYALFDSKLAEMMEIDDFWQLYSNYMSFSSATQLKMIFNQTIPLWIALPMLWKLRRHPGHMVLLCALLFLFSPLACIGISTAVLFWIARNLKAAMTLENITGLLILAVTGIFYMSNNNASSTHPSRILEWWKILIIGIGFYVLSIGVYLPFVWNLVKRDPTFIIMAATCFILPFLTLGDSDDLGRRATMSLTILLTYATIGQLNKYRSLSKWKRIALPIVLALGITDSATVLYCIPKDIIFNIEHDKYPKHIYMMGKLDDPIVNYHYNNFIADGESLYTKYLMKR